MSEPPLPNIFLLLEIDPDAPWSQTEFERVRDEKRREWSRLSQFPNKKGIEAKKNLGLIGELTKIANDEALRRSQAAEARKLRGEAQAEKLIDFNERLPLLESKGYIFEEELQNLVKEFGSILSEPQIRKRVRVPVKKSETSGAKPGKPALDTSLAKEIKNRLESLGKEDLYDFLGKGQAENHLLRQEAQSIYNRVNNKATKTPEDTLLSELSGYCLTIFKTEIERAKYNETLRLAGYEDLKQKVNTIGEFSKRIEATQIEQLLKEARQKKLDVKEAESIIIDHATRRGFAVITSDQITEIVSQQQVCGYCEQINGPEKKYCTNCAQLLKEPCPKCGQVVSSDELACGACGFATGNRYLVRFLLSDAQQVNEERNYAQAITYLEQAKTAWPVSGMDTLAKDIRELEVKTRSLYDEQQTLLRQMERSIQDKKFYAAQRLLPALKKILPGQSEEVEQYGRQIKSKISQVEAKLAQVRRTEDDAEQIVQFYQEVLQLCQDCQEAREMLAKTPPAPPQELQAQKSGEIIRLTWQPSTSRGVRYTVVRKPYTQPISVSDGTKLTTVNGTAYDDVTAETGLPFYYAVFADREGTISHDAAVLAKPEILLKDVEDLAAQVDDRQVHLRWQPPANFHEIVVVRSEQQYPRSIQAGHRVPIIDSSQAVDNNLKNQQRYYYTVFSQFKNHSGSILTTSGACIEAVPQQPPKPIETLEITASGPTHARELQFRWAASSKGDVVLLKSQRPFNLKYGTTIPQRELSKKGQIITAVSNHAIDTISLFGFYYYLPVVVFQGSGYIGKEQKYICVDDVSDLSVQNLGHALRLQWQWPPNCQEVLVVFSTIDWPEPEQSNSSTIALTRAQYELKGFFDILNPVEVDHFIAVFAVINQNGERIVSSGSTNGARKRVSLASRIIIRYEIKKSWLKAYSLDLSIAGSGTLPKLRLVRKQRTLPLRKHDGDTILEIENMPIEKNDLKFSLGKSAVRPQSYAKLFIEDENLIDTVIIRHPGLEKLKLF